MVGSWVWNAISGVVGMFFAFFGAILNNPLITSLERAIYGFVVAFLMMFGVRWFIGTFLGLKSPVDSEELIFSDSTNSISSTSSTGGNFDAETPDELDSLRQLIRDSVVGDFSSSENTNPRKESPPAVKTNAGASSPGYDDVDAFSSFGSVEDLLQSFDKPKSDTPSHQQMNTQSSADFNRSSSTNSSGKMPQGELTAEDLANAIRTSFLDD
jgi:hypothetical protein